METLHSGRPKIPPFRPAVAVVVALLAAVGSLLIAGPAQAATTSPAHCYQWPLEHVAAQWYGPGAILHTQQILVTPGSPCRDVNVRGVTANGRPTCRTMRVRWDTETSIATGPWTTVCTRWRALWNNAPEGRLFTIEIQGAPAMIGERD